MNFNYSFDGLKDTFNRYKIEKDKNNHIIIIDKISNSKIENEEIINRVKFATIWFKFMGSPVSIKVAEYDYKTRYNYAFSDKTRVIYDNMMNVISNELITKGDIDVLELIKFFKDNNLDRIEDIKKLFSEHTSIVALNRWFRNAIPDSMFPKKSVETYNEAINKLNNKKTL